MATSVPSHEVLKLVGRALIGFGYMLERRARRLEAKANGGQANA